MKPKPLEQCPICSRFVPENLWEKHHLIPRTEGGKDSAKVCVNCGDMIHKCISINDLRDKYFTIELIKTHEDIKKWVSWISKKPNDFTVCMKKKKRR